MYKVKNSRQPHLPLKSNRIKFYAEKLYTLMLLTFGILERARNHGKKSLTSYPGRQTLSLCFSCRLRSLPWYRGSPLWQYLRLPILGFGCRTLCCSLLLCNFVSPWMVKYFVVHMHQMNSRDKESVKSSFESNLI